jgi:hypothetical protein
MTGFFFAECTAIQYAAGRRHGRARFHRTVVHLKNWSGKIKKRKRRMDILFSSVSTIFYEERMDWKFLKLAL